MQHANKSVSVFTRWGRTGTAGSVRSIPRRSYLSLCAFLYPFLDLSLTCSVLKRSALMSTRPSRRSPRSSSKKRAWPGRTLIHTHHNPRSTFGATHAAQFMSAALLHHKPVLSESCCCGRSVNFSVICAGFRSTMQSTRICGKRMQSGSTGWMMV